MTGMRASISRIRLIDLQAGLVGQPHVQQDDVRRIAADALKAFRAGERHLDAVGRGGERLAHLLGDQGLVIIDEQQVGHEDRSRSIRKSQSAGRCSHGSGPQGGSPRVRQGYRQAERQAGDLFPVRRRAGRWGTLGSRPLWKRQGPIVDGMNQANMVQGGLSLTRALFRTIV